jgi:hypothetical protein
MTPIFDIFPRARKRLKISPAETARIVRLMVTLAPSKSWGIQVMIVCIFTQDPPFFFYNA